MKQREMLVVLFRSANFGFWSCLGCSGQKCQYFKLPKSCLGFCEETRNYAKRNRSQIIFLFSSFFFFFKWSLLGVKICLRDAQIGVL